MKKIFALPILITFAISLKAQDNLNKNSKNVDGFQSRDNKVKYEPIKIEFIGGEGLRKWQKAGAKKKKKSGTR